MKETEQTKGQTILQHGLSVFKYTNKLINKQYEGFRLPQWWSEYEEEILANIHEFKTIKHYTIFHDIGKPFCLSFGDSGETHFTDHANISYNTFKSLFPNLIDVGKLIKHDMLLHASTIDDIFELCLSKQDLSTLLISSLAELHSNADMFGGIDSTNFKIKWKRWNSIARKICNRLFNHPYMYILIRNDLSSRQKAVQACHASIESAKHLQNKNDIHPSTIICVVKNEAKLLKCAKELSENNYEYKLFSEPDLGNQYTALATKPVSGKDRNYFKKYKLLDI
jgi:hypothetical protein